MNEVRDVSDSFDDSSFEHSFDLFDASDSEEVNLQESSTGIGPTGIGPSGIIPAADLVFTFGSRCFSLRNDGSTIATCIWSSGLVAAILLHEGSFLDSRLSVDSLSVVNPDNSLAVVNLDVMEIGCGCALAGLAAALHGCKSLTLADCDDRALKKLFSAYGEIGTTSWWQECAAVRDLHRGTATSESNQHRDEGIPCHDFRFRHHLWEEDLKTLESCEATPYPGAESTSNIVESNIDHHPNIDRHNPNGQSFPRRSETTRWSVPHWSDAYRDEASCELLEPEAQFDVIIASDCLYFSSQELPLVAALQLRLKRTAKSFGLVVVQTRRNGGFQKIRLVQCFEKAGFYIEERDVSALSEHSYVNDQKSNTVTSLAATGFEVEKHALVVRWVLTTL